MKAKYSITLVALAAVCLLAAPVIAMPVNGGAFGANHGGMLLWADDLTAEEINNMTLGELKALKEQKQQELQNMTIAEIKELHQQKMEERENTTLGEFKDQKPMRNRDGFRGQKGQCPAGNNCDQMGYNFGLGMGPNMWLHPFLLMDDLTEEELNNMTLAEIDALKQQKMEELQNMTLAEIEELRQQKMEERENMTLGELREQRQDRRGMAGPFMEYGPAMGPNWQDGQSRGPWR